MKKPLLRGWSHQVAALFALGGGYFLVQHAARASLYPHAVSGTLIYALSLFTLFAVSATYHRPQWSPQVRAQLRRVDHSAIYLLIAGSSTAVGVLTLQDVTLFRFLLISWIGAAVGIGTTLFWIHAPRGLTALTYVAISFAAAPYFPQIRSALGPELWKWLFGGGLVYIAGAGVYARRWPDPWPTVFGYHEIFHALVIAASACHYTAIYRQLTLARV